MASKISKKAFMALAKPEPLKNVVFPDGATSKAAVKTRDIRLDVHRNTKDPMKVTGIVQANSEVTDKSATKSVFVLTSVIRIHRYAYSRFMQFSCSCIFLGTWELGWVECFYPQSSVFSLLVESPRLPKVMRSNSSWREPLAAIREPTKSLGKRSHSAWENISALKTLKFTSLSWQTLYLS